MIQILIRNIFDKLIDYDLVTEQFGCCDPSIKLTLPRYKLRDINKSTCILISFNFETNTGNAVFVDSTEGIVIHAQYDFNHLWNANHTFPNGVEISGSSGGAIIRAIHQTREWLESTNNMQQFITLVKTDSYDVF